LALDATGCFWPTVACFFAITLVCPRPGMAASSGLVSTSNVVSIGGMVSTSVAVNNFQRGGQRLPERWSTNTSALSHFRAASFPACTEHGENDLALS